MILITSIINTPTNPLSYSKTRSVFTREERFSQTKRTIESIKQKLPHSKIIIVECTDFIHEEQEYFNKTCHYVLNLWKNKDLHDNIFGPSKSLGEGTMTIAALKYIIDNNLDYTYLYKISGRYWLNDKFKLDEIKTNVFKQINHNTNNIFTALYKIDKDTVYKLFCFLVKNITSMRRCIGYEVLFASFVVSITEKEFVDPIGLSGFVTVCGSEYNG